jgi:hypothetical protein
LRDAWESRGLMGVVRCILTGFGAHWSVRAFTGEVVV